MKNNFITKIIGATLAFAMMIGGAVGINASKEAKEVNAVEGSATYLHAMSTKPSNGDNTLSSVTWTVSGNNIGSMNTSNYAGVQFGTKSASGSITFTSKNAWGAQSTATSYYGKTRITEIRVWLNAGTGTPTATVTIGGKTATSDGTTVAKNSSAESYEDATCVTYTPATGGDSGIVVITASTSSKAGYFCAMEIDCEEPATGTPTVTASPDSLFFRTSGNAQSVTATASYFTGSVSYSWAYQSGIDCVDLTNASSATVTMTPKNSITSLSSGVYRVTATYSSESAFADVTVIVDNGGSAKPYTIAEARAAITNGTGLEDAYVKGIIYKIDSYSQQYHSITYWISDDGTNAVPFEVYSGLNIDGANFSAITDLSLGDIVVVKGELKKNGSTYELNYNNQLVSRNSVASIAVKTAPTKVDYNSNESFDPTGLVVTATYADSTTIDYSYSSMESQFTFNPTTSTAVGNNDSVSITLFGKTTSQPINVTVRAIAGVTLMGDMSKKDYYTVDSWDLTGLYLSITWNVGTPNPTTINLSDVNPSNYEFDEENPRLGLNQLYIYGMYEGFEFEKTITGIDVSVRPTTDILRTANTSFGLTNTSYTAFSNKTNTLADIESNATWAGTAACNTGKNNSLQLNGNTRGIYTTASSGQYLKSVSVDFNDDNGKELYFYGSNTAFTAVSQTIADNDDCTLVATLDEDTLSVNIDGNYKYVYIFSSGAIYMNSITVMWKTVSEEIEESITTNTELSYRYTKDGNNYSFSDISMRFGGLISKDLWNDLDTSEHLIEGFGVMFTSTDVVHAPDSIKSKAGEAVAASANNDYANTLVNFYMPKASMATPAEDGDDYYWNLFFSVDFDEISINKYYVAAAYIKVDGEYVFMKEVKYSVASLAQDYLDHRNCDGATAEGSLAKLASLSPAE